MTSQIEPPVARRVSCGDCLHFRESPYGAGTPWKRKTGCYHPDLMVQRQADPFLVEQQVPGDHEKLNLRGDCAKFERRAPRRTLVQRLLTVMFS